MKTRDYWRWEARKSKDPMTWSAYRNFRQEVKKEIKVAEREFFAEQIQKNRNNRAWVSLLVQSYCIVAKSRVPRAKWYSFCPRRAETRWGITESPAYTYVQNKYQTTHCWLGDVSYMSAARKDQENASKGSAKVHHSHKQWIFWVWKQFSSEVTMECRCGASWVV